MHNAFTGPILSFILGPHVSTLVPPSSLVSHSAVCHNRAAEADDPPSNTASEGEERPSATYHNTYIIHLTSSHHAGRHFTISHATQEQGGIEYSKIFVGSMTFT